MKYAISALVEFGGRYLRILRAAWTARELMEPPVRSKDELAFLPAHLELTETPVSPAGRWSIRLIIGVFVIALLWSCIGEVDIVAVAQGKTVAGSRTKVIQPAETAVVRRILVQDGQGVRKGQVLIELDRTAASADYEKAGDALVNALAAAARLEALAQALDTKQPPHVRSTELPPARVRAEQGLASSQFAAYRAHRANLQAAVRQREAELRTGASQIGALEQTAAIATSRAKDYASLVKDQYVSRQDYLLREQERLAAERELLAQRSHLAELGASLQAAREALGALEADTRQQTLDGLRQAREQIGQSAPDVARTGQRDQLMQLRSPVDGTVQQLAIHTVGGVVTPAQALLAVVPSQDSLEVEATIQNKDIGFVHPGQRATVKVESFPYTRYGYLEGVVQSVSRDAAQDEKNGLVFPARVKLQETTLRIDDTRVALSPGMSLTVEIQTGRRRVIAYLLSPLQQRSAEALHER